MCELLKNELPNLFQYATKELSQDALICWLLEWSNHRHRTEHATLHKCGLQFVCRLLRKHGLNPLRSIHAIEIYRQVNRMDVLVRVNGQHVILIEDKTVTMDHCNQLERYYGCVIEGETRLGIVPVNNLYPIYFKTGNQTIADDHRIENLSCGRGWKIFNRSDFLTVLNDYSGRNAILVEYRQYLQILENETNSFIEWKGEDKRECWLAWEGFFRHLERKLEDDARRDLGWGYVHNKSGGFLGFWWHPSDSDRIYLQIEGGSNNAKLCFKVDATEETSERKQELKWYWHDRIIAFGKQQVMRPKVLRIGNTMTVAWWSEEWLAFDTTGKLDVAATVENLMQAESILKRAVET